jgi:hypothetical protein
MDAIQFAHENIRLNEKGKPWSLAKYQREGLLLAYRRHYTIRLWSEVKKSGKTFLAAAIAIWEAITNADCEVVCCANDEEQARSTWRRSPKRSALECSSARGTVGGRYSHTGRITARGAVALYKLAVQGRRRTSEYPSITAST